MAVRFVSCSRSRWLRGKRKLRPGETTQARHADATDVSTGNDNAGSSQTCSSKGIESGCERKPELVADGMRERGLQDAVLSRVEERLPAKMVHVFQGADRPARI